MESKEKILWNNNIKTEMKFILFSNKIKLNHVAIQNNSAKKTKINGFVMNIKSFITLITQKFPKFLGVFGQKLKV